MRYLDSLEPLERFLQLKAQMEAIKTELDELKGLLYAAVSDEDGQTYTHAGYTLTAHVRKSYEYSGDVQAKAQELRATNTQATYRPKPKNYALRILREERDGTAICTKATGYVRVSDADRLPFAA